MTSHTPGPRVQPEGTSLPPPRPFGEANTLTVPRRRRHAPGQGSVVALTAATAVAGAGAALRAEIMRVTATPVTVTF